ncbi:MAG: helix-turn-helix transcriptional regulator [Acidimicrobiales bacterium]
MTYSGYVEGETLSDNLPSPEFATLDEAIGWALERTDFVVARDIGTPYFWAGVGDPPDGLPLRDEIPNVEGSQAERLIREPSTIDPSEWLHKARTKRKWSVNQLAAASGVSDERISQFERGELGGDDRLDIWVKLVCALEERQRKRDGPKWFAIFREDWLKYAFEVTESSSNDAR